MAQQDYNPETALSFLSALAFTIDRIEKGQPEPRFREVFMGLLDQHLEAVVTNDEARGVHTRDDVEIIRKMLGGLLVSKDLSDALGDGA